MTRRISGDAPVWKPPQDDQTVWTLSLKTITPVFGGSATPREVDEKHPARAASIRGHLRFWWRATTGASFDSAEALFAAEEALWGSAKKPGKVSVRVQITSCGKPQKCAEFVKNQDGKYKAFPDFALINPESRNDKRTWPPYALQPFQGELAKDRMHIKEEPAKAQMDVTFTVELRFPATVRHDIEQAVAAWVHFGGVGARTRRGCGSLACSDTQVRLQPAGPHDASLLTGLPHCYFLGRESSSPLIAWEQAVNLYRDFRQKVNFARSEGRDDKGRPKPGRSWWPEADSIRRMTGRSSPGHRPVEKPERAFPRADLGLPIIFHFKDEKAGDPADTTLEGATKEQTRFASPVITKALALGGNRYVPMVALLQSPRVWEAGNLVLKQERGTTNISRSDVEIAGRPTQGQTNIREAFIQFAKQNGFEEVRL